MAQPWTFLYSKILHTCRIFTLKREGYRSPRTGKDHDFYLLDSSDWVNVIPLTPEGKVILVKQYPFGTKDFTLEIPEGMIDEGDTPPGAAARELLEETGYGGDEPVHLGTVHPNPAIHTNRCYTYLIPNAISRKHPQQDSTEDREVLSVPLSEIPGLIREGKITHEYDVPIFYDGSYDELILEGRRVDFRKIARGKVPFIYGSSLSKNFCYTGARLGWVAFHGDQVGRGEERILPPLHPAVVRQLGISTRCSRRSR